MEASSRPNSARPGSSRQLIPHQVPAPNVGDHAGPPGQEEIATALGFIRTPRCWNGNAGDLILPAMTRLPFWPPNLTLLVRDTASNWSVRYTQGAEEANYDCLAEPEPNDVVLERVNNDHYNVVISGQTQEIRPDGDCLFAAIRQGLFQQEQGLGQPPADYRPVQELREAVADYYSEHADEMANFIGTSDVVSMEEQLHHQEILSQVKEVLFATQIDSDAIEYIARIFRAQQETSDHGNRSDLETFRGVVRYLNDPSPFDAFRELNSLSLLPHRLPPEIMEMIKTRIIEPRRLDLNINLDLDRARRRLEYLLLPGDDGELGNIDQLLAPQVLVGLHNNFFYEYGYTVSQAVRLFGVENDNDSDDASSVASNDSAKERAIESWEADDAHDESELEALTDPDYCRRVERALVEFETALSNHPRLARRADLVFERAPILRRHADGLFPLGQLSKWIRDPEMSKRRIELICRFAATRFEDLRLNEAVDVEWMQDFSDDRIKAMLDHQSRLENFVRCVTGNGIEFDMAAPQMPILGASLDQMSDERLLRLLAAPRLLEDLELAYLVNEEQVREVWATLLNPRTSDGTFQALLNRHSWEAPGSNPR